MYVTELACSRCGARYPQNVPMQTCPACGAPLLVLYDLEALRRALSPAAFIGREASLWRYRELLPLPEQAEVISFGEGMTPLVSLPRYSRRFGIQLMMKDEGLLPTGCFKARGAAVGVSMAKYLGVRTLSMPTAGNAGGAWTFYSVRAGIRTIIAMPQDAQEINKKECAAGGAALFLVNGIINDAGKIISAAAAKNGWYDASTLKEPYRIEGKKTMGLEIAEQLGWRAPDVIVYPTGGGVGVIAIHKAMQELLELGWIEGPPPRLVAVQSDACAPIPKAWREGKAESEYWPNPATAIPGLRVPKALGDFLILRAIYESNGCAVAVSDAESYRMQRELAATEGCFICPEGASTLAATARLVESGWIRNNERVVLLNTACGLKYPETIDIAAPVLEPGDPLPDLPDNA